jgi:uncharacterized protein with ParB-like and HNH nuclease domain
MNNSTQSIKMKHEPYSISDIIYEIEKNNFLLPAIQRSFVWKQNQIENFFDSLFQGFPIGSLLLWKGEDASKMNLVSFITEYKKGEDNTSFSRTRKDTQIAVLDGQQRLTALNIGFRGTYEGKKLYLNLNFTPNEEKKFEFKFKKEPEDGWFCMQDVTFPLDAKKDAIANLFLNHTDTFNILSNLTTESSDLIPVTLLTINELEDVLQIVLEIFVRVNSGGTALSKADLLLSTLVQNDANVRSGVNEISKAHKISKDFILKSAFVCVSEKAAYRVKAFTENASQINTNFAKIKESIEKTLKLITEFGYDVEKFPTFNALIPIVFQFYSKKQPDKEKVRKWLACVIIKGEFGQSSDSVIEKYIENLETPNPTKEELEEVLSNPKNLNIVFSLLYPNRIKGHQFDVDHIFSKKELKGIDNAKVESIANKQLLDATQNKRKSGTPAIDWINENSEYTATTFIEDKELYKNFDKFLKARNEEILKRLKGIFGLK